MSPLDYTDPPTAKFGFKVVTRLEFAEVIVVTRFSGRPGGRRRRQSGGTFTIRNVTAGRGSEGTGSLGTRQGFNREHHLGRDRYHQVRIHVLDGASRALSPHRVHVNGVKSFVIVGFNNEWEIFVFSARGGVCGRPSSRRPFVPVGEFVLGSITGRCQIERTMRSFETRERPRVRSMRIVF